MHEGMQLILNLYNSGINPEIIVLELDTNKDEVMQIISDEVNKRTQETPSWSKLGSPFINKLYLDADWHTQSIKFKNRIIFSVYS